MDSEQLAVPSVPIDGFRCLLGSARNGDDGKQNLKLQRAQGKDVRRDGTSRSFAAILAELQGQLPKLHVTLPPSALALLQTRSGGSSDKAIMRSGSGSAVKQGDGIHAQEEDGDD